MGYYWIVKAKIGKKGTVRTFKFGGEKWHLRSEKDIKNWFPRLVKHQTRKTVKIISIKKVTVKKRRKTSARGYTLF